MIYFYSLLRLFLLLPPSHLLSLSTFLLPPTFLSLPPLSPFHFPLSFIFLIKNQVFLFPIFFFYNPKPRRTLARTRRS